MQFSGIGSMMTVHTHDAADPDSGRHRAGNQDVKELFYFDMVAAGIWIARRGMFAMCLPIGDAECDKLAAAVEEFLATKTQPAGARPRGGGGNRALSLNQHAGPAERPDRRPAGGSVTPRRAIQKIRGSTPLWACRGIACWIRCRCASDIAGIACTRVRPP